MPPLNQFFKMAVMAGVESAVQIHIDRGDDLNARDSNGLTLLMLSAARNKAAMCRLLLSAGADKTLLDPSGRTAHNIAIAAAAHLAAEVLDPPEAIPQLPAIPEPPTDAVVALVAEQAIEVELISEKGPEQNSPSLLITTFLPALDFEDDEDGFSLPDWEPEEDLLPPETDLALVAEASAAQAAISAHEPFDSSADWDDVDAFLPDQSVPFIRADDVEARQRLRLLLLRAHREGSVPSSEIESLSMNEAGSANPEFAALLTLVVNDLGAEIDERFEYSSPIEDFTVSVSPHETEDEEELVDSAMRVIDSAASRRAEPLRIFLRDFQKFKLISGDEEVALAQRMEGQYERALNALVLWPMGIAEVLIAGRQVEAKRRTLFSLSKGPLEAQSEMGDADEEPAIVVAAETVVDDSDEDAEESVAASDSMSNFFSDALLRLNELMDNPQPANRVNQIKEHLEALRLSTAFLLELAKTAATDSHESAHAFAAAVTGYLNARDQMAAANLKLAFHTAKKYLYSGEPLDDLAQEANIGLMKAVERFDWRLGYKFSTYATWWIRQQVSRAVADTVRTIRIPVHVHESLQKLSREARAFESEKKRPPKADELAERLGISLQKLKMLESIPEEPTAIDDEFDDALIDASAHDRLVSKDPFESCVESQFRRAVDTVVSSLKPKEEKVTRLRFGLGGIAPHTLEEVGTAYGLTRERIRQIEAKALGKLRKPSYSDPLALAFFGSVPARAKSQASSEASADGAADTVETESRTADKEMAPALEGSDEFKGDLFTEMAAPEDFACHEAAPSSNAR